MRQIIVLRNAFAVSQSNQKVRELIALTIILKELPKSVDEMPEQPIKPQNNQPTKQPRREKSERSSLQKLTTGIKTTVKVGFYTTLAAAALFLAEQNNGFIEHYVGNEMRTAERRSEITGKTAQAGSGKVKTFTAFGMQYPNLEQKLSEATAVTTDENDIIIKDKKGNVLAEKIQLEKYVTLDNIAKNMQWAIIAAEDVRFYRHAGIDHGSTIAALYHNLTQKNKRMRGASTISIQLADQLLPDKSDEIETKKQEWSYALLIENTLKKDKILEYYLNTVQFGYSRREKQEIKGIQAAAKYYFGKDAKELSLTESVILSSMINLPTVYGTKTYTDLIYDNIEKEKSKNFQRLLTRASYVLNRLKVVAEVYKNTGITEQQWFAVKKDLNYEKINFHENSKYAIMPEAYEYVDAALDRVIPLLNTSNTKNTRVEIEVGMDSDLQRYARGVFTEHRDNLRKQLKKQKFKHPELISGSIVVLDLATDNVLALVGNEGVDKEDYLNRAVIKYLSPGSSVKPFVLAAALDHGYTLDTTFVDEKKTYKIPKGRSFTSYTPQNFGDFSNKAMTLHDALVSSTNSIFIALTGDLLTNYGAEDFRKSLQKFGLPLKEAYLSSGIGAFPVTLLDLAGAYAALEKKCTAVKYLNGAAGAASAASAASAAIDDKKEMNGDINLKLFTTVNAAGVVYEEKPASTEAACSPETQQTLDTILQEVVVANIHKNGYMEKMNAKYPLRGKTGTARANIVFVAYQPELQKLVAVAFASDNSDISGKFPHNIVAAQYAAPAALEIMTYLAERADGKDAPQKVFSITKTRRSRLSVD